jgi:flagellar basal-body rod modification protein FlgD
MVDAISSGAVAPSGSRSTLAANFDTFLQLLTTQLANQDPLSPMEADKFTEQLVQFTSVEQQLETNQQLTQLVGMMRDAETTAALDYLGKEVIVAGSSLHLPAEGAVQASYVLPASAETLSIDIFDQDGRVVRRLEGDMAAGEHVFSWDGLMMDGRRADPGVYRIDIVASDAAENPIESEILSGGYVDGIEANDDGISLLVNGVATPLSAVRNIKQGNEA